MCPSILEHLDAIAQEHDQSQGFTPRLIAYRAQLLAELVPTGSLIDVGCADGLLTAQLCQTHSRVLGIDASPIRLQRAADATAECPHVEYRQLLFEELADALPERFDVAILSCVLEHLEDPVGLLRSAAELVRPAGKVVAIVPHAESLHRRAGVLLGMLQDLDDSGETDRRLDHQQNYTRARLAADFAAAGMELAAAGGYLLKPLPNPQMASLPLELVDAYFQLGRQFPELAAEIYAVGVPR